jgi:hypothetical protein
VLAAIPASVVLSRRIVTHTNATIGYTPGARNALGDRADAWQLGLGQSLVWLARPRINFLVELAWTRTQQVLARDHVAWNESLAISPGIRAALDFSSGLQIVPGLALPIGLGVSRGERAAFAYLSFEHPFSR